MILTGSEIKKEQLAGRISISPFDERQINPNSYNYRLGPLLKVYVAYSEGESRFEEIMIPAEGFVLKPNVLYLGHTFEVIGSKAYAISLIGRSSIGRLGLFVQLAANLGHTGTEHQWTLELVAAKPIKVYPGMLIGQVSFWTNQGSIDPYVGYYGQHNRPQQSARSYDINRA